EMTVIKSQPGSTGSMQLNDFTGVAPNANCPFPPPTEAMKGLSNTELKERAIKLSKELESFAISFENQESPMMNEKQRAALDQRETEEFKSVYLVRAMELNNAIAARSGPIEIP